MSAEETGRREPPHARQESRTHKIMIEETIMSNQEMQEATEPNDPKCIKILEEGISTGEDFCRAMGALMGDLASQRLKESVGNAICNAGGKMLKAVEMNIKYGQSDQGSNLKNLRLINKR